MTPKSISKWFIIPFFVFLTNTNLQSQTTIFEENFSSASGDTPPAGWTNVINSGGNSGQDWVFDDTSPNITGAGFSGNYAILDSDGYGSGNTQNATLTTLSFDASTYTDLELSFSNQFRRYTSGESCTIEIYNGSSWVNVDTYSSSSENYPTAAVKTYNINALANGATNARIRFTYVGTWGYWWAIDNVKVTGTPSAPLIPITITADAKSKEFGDSDPPLTYQITSGSLQGGDTLSGSLSRNAGEAIGTYTINQGTLNNPKYNITYVSAIFTINEKDTDGDGIGDSTDIDDDNDGILDTDEICIIPGAAIPTGDAEDWIDGDYSVFGIGNNTNGLGYQESGFQQAAYNRGISLTVLDDSVTNYALESPTSSSSPLSTDDRVYFGLNPTTGSNDGVVTFTTNYNAPNYDGGSVGCSTFPTGNNSELRTTTSSEFASGSTSQAIYVVPERGAVTGNSYSVNIAFTTPVYAFSFDINDVFDTTPGSTTPTYNLEVFADGKLLAFMTADNFGNDVTGTMELYRGDKTTLVNNSINIGNQTEATIGFVTFNGITNVEIRTTIVSGDISNCARDAHGIDNFAYGTTAPSCTAGDIDFDGDGINNDKDLDSDNDGIPDNIEAQTTIDYITPSYLYGTNGLDSAYENNDTLSATGLTPVNTDGSPDNSDFTDLDSDGDGIFDTAEVGYSIDSDNDGKSNGVVGTNGLDNSLFAADNYTDVNAAIDNPTLLTDTDSDAVTFGDVDYRDTQLSGSVMISQIHHTASGRMIEVTNIHATNTIHANSLKLVLFSDKTGDQTNISPDQTYTIPTDLGPGESVVITSANPLTSAITNFDGGNDIIMLTHPKGDPTGITTYKNRYETTYNLNNNTSYVRTDEVANFSKEYISTQWVAFVDDSLDPYRDLASGGPERHPHDPLISEITAASSESNLAIGTHKINPTYRTGNTWNNGIPDRTRRVIINENYNHTSGKLSARTLEVSANSKLNITNNLLVVTGDINLSSTNDEIRLIGTSQLVQTHTGITQVSGNGKLLIDQNSTVPSLYRYNYMSSPVNTVGANTYTIESVLKDGTNPLDATTVIGNAASNVAKDITFIGGYDGNNSAPISLAEYWIYTYAPGSNGRSNWLHRYRSGTINQTDGFIFKGPGVAQNYTFVGTPKDGDLAASSIGADESYLVGNPFSSAISVKKFIEDNINSTTATLYFWEHVGEDDATGSTSGHNYAGYIGGYATRNIAMGLSANDVTLVGAFNITLEAEEAFIQGSIVNNGGENAVVMNSQTNFVQFQNIIKGVDILRINYKSENPKNIKLVVDGLSNSTTYNYTLPSTTDYSYFDIEICVEAGSDVKFMSDDSNITFINHLKLQDDDGNISCAPTSGGSGANTVPGAYIPVGQGFFISGDADGGPIVFNNSQREYITEGNGSVFFRGELTNRNNQNSTSEYKLPIVKLGMDFINNEGTSIHRQIGLSFNPNNSFAFDKGYDSEIYDIGVTDFYWKLPNDELKYVIAGVQEITSDLEIPFDIIMDYDGSITIKIDDIKEITRDLYIKDNFTGQTHLLNNNTVALQLYKGTHSGRFSIVFESAEVLSVEDNISEAIKNRITIYLDNSEKEIVIQNNGDSIIEKVELFNILGQKINDWKSIENKTENRFKTRNLAKNIYVVNVKTNKGIISKKVLIE